MKGKIISFEGIDGSGKSTQSKRLSDFLLSKGKKVLYLREPGSTGLGQEIRRIVKEWEGTISQFAELFIFLAARAQMVDEHLEEGIWNYDFIVIDRYYHSSVAYQSGIRINAPFVCSCNKAICFEYEPDVVILLDAYPDKSYESKEMTDRIERRGESYMNDVAGRYREMALKSKKFLKIDTLEEDMETFKSEDEIAGEILKKLSRKL